MFKDGGYEGFEEDGTSEVENEHTIVKMIQTFEGKLYALDHNGNVGTQPARQKKEFTWVLQHCTDIYLTDCLYARQFYLDDTGQLKS